MSQFLMKHKDRGHTKDWRIILKGEYYDGTYQYLRSIGIEEIDSV